MKKLLSILLAAVTTFSMVACGGAGNAPAKDPGTSVASTSGSTATPVAGDATAKKYKIGVMEIVSNDESVTRRAYYETYVAPNYNVEFMFSEAIAGTEAAMSFVENCADAGADGIISFYYDDAAQLSQVCQDNNLKLIINSNRSPKIEDAFTGGYTSFAGSFGSNVQSVGDVFAKWLRDNASADGSEGFIITTATASQGGTQQIEVSTAIMEVLQEKYDLTFEDTIANMVVSPAPLVVKNNKNLNIYIYPGKDTQDGFLQGLSTTLQTGKYLTFLHQSGYPTTAVVVDEAERSINKDIKVAAIGNMSQTLIDAFNAKDKFGSSSINMSTIKSVSLLSGIAFAKIYNAITGFDACNTDAKKEPGVLRFPMWSVSSVAEVDAVKSWDVLGNDKWVCDSSVIDRMLGIKNPELTHAGIEEIINTITFEDAEKRLG